MKRTPKQLKAIQHHMDKTGASPQLSVWPNVTFKLKGETYTRTNSGLVREMERDKVKKKKEADR